MQVYKGMDIGTAKPTSDERARVTHHLLDLTEPWEDFSVARFQIAARAAIAGIEERGRTALVVGGSGLYVRAILDGLDVPGRYPDARDALERESDTAALHRRLEQLDPVAAGRMLPSNRRRVLRALEVTVGSGRRFSTFGNGLDTHAPIRFAVAGIWLPGRVIGARIEARYKRQLDSGFVDEVSTLARRPGGLSRTAGQGLGYREVIEHLEGSLGLEEAEARAIRRTRAFARRQRVWFRRDPRTTWYGAATNPLAVVPALLRDWSRWF